MVFCVACISCLLYFTIVHRFENQLVYFKGTGLPEKKNYEVTIPLYGEIIPEECVQHNIGRCIEVVLVKVSLFYLLTSLDHTHSHTLSALTNILFNDKLTFIRQGFYNNG